MQIPGALSAATGQTCTLGTGFRPALWCWEEWACKCGWRWKVSSCLNEALNSIIWSHTVDKRWSKAKIDVCLWMLICHCESQVSLDLFSFENHSWRGLAWYSMTANISTCENWGQKLVLQIYFISLTAFKKYDFDKRHVGYTFQLSLIVLWGNCW